VTHVTNITNITTIVNNPQQAVTQIDYRNRRFPHAVTVVPQTVMVNRQPVAPAAAQIRNTAVVQQLTQQPVQRVVVSAPQVATPTITPAIAQARRIVHGNERLAEAGHALAPSPLVVPPSPPRVNGTLGRVDADPRAERAAAGDGAGRAAGTRRARTRAGDAQRAAGTAGATPAGDAGACARRLAATGGAAGGSAASAGPPAWPAAAGAAPG